MNATGVTAGPVESNGKLLLGKWRDSLHVTCGLTACTPGSAPGPTLGNEYGKTLPFLQLPISTVGATYGIRSLRRFNESSGTIWRQTGQGRLGWRHGVAVSGVRRMNEVNARRARLVPGG